MLAGLGRGSHPHQSSCRSQLCCLSRPRGDVPSRDVPIPRSATLLGTRMSSGLQSSSPHWDVTGHKAPPELQSLCASSIPPAPSPWGFLGAEPCAESIPSGKVLGAALSSHQRLLQCVGVPMASCTLIPISPYASRGLVSLGRPNPALLGPSKSKQEQNMGRALCRAEYWPCSCWYNGFWIHGYSFHLDFKAVGAVPTHGCDSGHSSRTKRC